MSELHRMHPNNELSRCASTTVKGQFCEKINYANPRTHSNAEQRNIEWVRCADDAFLSPRRGCAGGGGQILTATHFKCILNARYLMYHFRRGKAMCELFCDGGMQINLFLNLPALR